MDAHILHLDKPRKLKYAFRALKEIKKKYGQDKSMAEVMNVDMDEIPYFVWVGLAWEDSKLTVEQVEELIEDAIPERYTVIGLISFITNAIVEQTGFQGKKKVKAEKKEMPSSRTVKSRIKSGSPRKKSSTA
ncbi:MAG: hypothetical protein KAJ19_15445 [Gammaproteobacteria bacterium]|nr:hypothetical protein [Gammaproteobacteria bacterium]